MTCYGAQTAALDTEGDSLKRKRLLALHWVKWAWLEESYVGRATG